MAALWQAHTELSDCVQVLQRQRAIVDADIASLQRARAAALADPDAFVAQLSAVRTQSGGGGGGGGERRIDNKALLFHQE